MQLISSPLQLFSSVCKSQEFSLVLQCLHQGRRTSFPVQTRVYAESILDWDFLAVMHCEERGAGSLGKLLPISLLVSNSCWSHILQNLVMKENLDSVFKFYKLGKGREGSSLCKVKSREHLGGECRGKKQDPAVWGWEY